MVDPFLQDILRQPEAMRSLAGALASRLEDLERLAGEATGRSTLVITGMGGSYHAGYPALNELASLGVPAHLVDTAELLHFRRPILDARSLLVLVSQSGRSAELVRLVEALPEAPARPFLVSVTNGLDNPLAESADVSIDTLSGHEMGPSTVTFATSLVALSAIAAILGGEEPAEALDRTRIAAGEAAGAIEGLLATPGQSGEGLAERLGGRPMTVLLARGASRAASEMGALLLKEAAGLPAEALEAAQFRHGPLELAGGHLAALVFATEPETRELDLRLAAELVETGAAVLAVTSDGEAPPGALGIATGRLDRTVASAPAIVPVQLLAWRLALRLGRTPGVLTRATKVTARE